jgi:hypothetical protein
MDFRKYFMIRFFWYTLLWLSLAIGNALANPTKEVGALGGYSNIKTSTDDDPHQFGYSVTLFRRADGQVFGEFTYAPGTTEGFGGRLYDVKHVGNRFAFKAKVSAGQSSSGGPDKTLFDFIGILGRGAIVGTMTTWDGYSMRRPVRVEKVRLKRNPVIDMSPADYVEYLKYAPAVNW